MIFPTLISSEIFVTPIALERFVEVFAHNMTRNGTLLHWYIATLPSA
jgi:hypothetical protein